MPDIFTLENKIKQMIDEMKGLCQTNGLSNQANEEVVITSVFLYKFLNDKFMANMKDFAKEMDMGTEEVLQDEDMFAGFYDSYPQDVAFKYEDTIKLEITIFIGFLTMHWREFLIIQRMKNLVLIQQTEEESRCLPE